MNIQVTSNLNSQYIENLKNLINQSYREGEQGILEYTEERTRLSVSPTTLEDQVRLGEIITVNLENEVIGTVRFLEGLKCQ